MNDIVERLLPCPCGAEARIYDVSGITEPRGKKVIACIDPDCDWSMTGYGDDQAIKRWNRRATQPVAAKGEPYVTWSRDGIRVDLNRFLDTEAGKEAVRKAGAAPPSAPAAVEVTEEMVERYLLAECQAINCDDSEYMASDRDREIVRAALTAALTKPGAGE